MVFDIFAPNFQEKRQQLEKESREKEEINKQKKKQMEAEWKAEQKYKTWLQMKSLEKSALERKEKVCCQSVCFVSCIIQFSSALKITFLH